MRRDRLDPGGERGRKGSLAEGREGRQGGAQRRRLAAECYVRFGKGVWVERAVRASSRFKGRTQLPGRVKIWSRCVCAAVWGGWWRLVHFYIRWHALAGPRQFFTAPQRVVQALERRGKKEKRCYFSVAWYPSSIRVIIMNNIGLLTALAINCNQKADYSSPTLVQEVLISLGKEVHPGSTCKTLSSSVG